MLPLTDRIAILVDEGIATGSTFFASLKSIRRFKPRRLIGSIPVGPIETIQEARITGITDGLAVLATRDPFRTVGNHYLEFAQVSDHDKEQPYSSMASPPR